MTISTQYNYRDLPESNPMPIPARDTSGITFANQLETEKNKIEETQSSEKERQSNRFSDAIATIKEKGLLNYLKELEEEKKAKLREEILTAMGITEEDLADMPAEERAAIEKIVEDEIKKRMAANQLMNQDENKNSGQEQFQYRII